MKGAQTLIQTLVNGGVNVCFTNPGTSEMHFVAVVDNVPGMRVVLGLFEGVCTGAADGYARMTGKPASTLLHLGPGLANGLANLHNARRANSPVVNIVGDHATYHLQYDAPLTADIVSFARPVSTWIKSAESAQTIGEDGAEAIAAAMTPPGHIATLIAPADCTWNEGGPPAPAPKIPRYESVSSERVDQIAAVLKRGEPAAILLGGSLLLAAGSRLAGRVAVATGAKLFADTLLARQQRGAGRARVERLPYAVDQAVETLSGLKHLIIAGSKPPVTFFAYPGKPSWLTPEGCQIHYLSRPDEDGLEAMAALVEALNAPEETHHLYTLNRPNLPGGTLTTDKVWAAVAALMPEETIISDESVTSGRNADPLLAGAPPFDRLGVTGGAIGIGLPLSVGAAVACPDQQVLAMEADGSAMYTIQALWTQAREQLNVVTVLFANRAYRILQGELDRVGAANTGQKALSLLALDNPDLGWVGLAEGMGVSASRATTAEEFNDQLAAALKTNGPHLIEAVV